MNKYLSYTLEEVLKEYPKAKKYEVGSCLVVDPGTYTTYRKNGKTLRMRDFCHFYDKQTGYVLLTNYPTVEIAKDAAQKQKGFGVDAIVGPMAPFPYGEPLFEKRFPNGAGVYYRVQPRQLKGQSKKSSKLPIIKTNSPFTLTKKRAKQVTAVRKNNEVDALKDELIAMLQARQKELQQKSGDAEQ